MRRHIDSNLLCDVITACVLIMDDREITLANFQAATGIDDITYCIELLEKNDWNLVVSLHACSWLFLNGYCKDMSKTELFVRGCVIPRSKCLVVGFAH
jgi:hypothetical protein